MLSTRMKFRRWIFSFFQVAPWDTELRIMRADCHENMGDFISAISDIK